MKYAPFTAFFFFAVLCSIAHAREPVVVAFAEGSADVPVGRAVVEEAYRRAGIPVEFHGFSASEALRMSNSGQVDAELQRIDGISNTYEHLVKVPIPVNFIQGVAFSKKYRFPVRGWHSLRPYRIGIVRGIVFAEQQTAGMTRVLYDSYTELVDALRKDEIEVGVMIRIEGQKALRTLEEEGIEEMEGVLETLFLYHYVHESRSDLIPELEPILKDMLLSGESRRMRFEGRDAMKEQP